MNTELIYTIAVTVGTVAFGFLSAYLKTKSKLKDKVNEGIANAEAEYSSATKAGGEKFEYVVDFLYQYVPSALKPVFPRSMISQIIQSAFDQIQRYAVQQLDKCVDKITGEESNKVESKED